MSHPLNGESPLDPRGPEGGSGEARAAKTADLVPGAVLRLGGPPAKAAPQPAQTLHWTVFLGALARCWRRALCCGLPVGLLAAAAAWYLLPPPQYTSRALLHVAARPPRVLGNVGGGEGDFAGFQRTQLAMLKTRKLLEAALMEPGAADMPSIKRRHDPVRWLQQKLEADFSTGPEILRISLSGDRPEDLPVVVNAIARTYLRDFADEAANQRQAHLKRLQAIRAELEAKLKPKKEALIRQAPDGGVGDPKVLAYKQQLALDMVAVMKKELITQHMELIKLQIAASVREQTSLGGQEPDIPDATVDAEMWKDASIQMLHQSWHLAQQREAQAKKDYTPDAPELVQKTHAVQEAKQALDEAIKTLRPWIVKQLQQQARAAELIRDREHQERVAVVKQLESKLTAAVQDAEARAMKAQAPDVDALREETEQKEALIRRVTAEVAALNIELLAPQRITLLEDAELPEAVDNASQVKKTAGAGIAMIGLVVFAFTWWEVRAQRIASVQDVTRGLGVPVVATLPALPVSPSPVRREALPPRYALAQGQLTASVDAASTVLLHAANLQSLRVVLISSATPREGKTTLACNLAAGLARAGRKVVLVDGDLRRPSLHRVFDLPPSPGFREVLRGEADLADVIRPTFCRGLVVLPTADWPGSALEVLTGNAVPALFARLKADYDLVLVDSGPILAACEPLLLGQHADGVVLTVRRNVTTAPAVEAAYQRLRMLGIRVVGAVVNGANDPPYAQGYYYSV
jgi:capsular exopolysaccharide synthesis family protein